MVTRFVKNNEVWDVILDHLKRAKGNRSVAIAYCHTLDLLPLKKGDVLICDASEHAIETGQTNAEALKALIVKRKVKVFSVEGLHAKIVIAGDHAIVGSMNASENSRSKLLEAAIVSDDVAVLRAAEAWIQELQEDRKPIGIRAVNKLCRIDVKRRGGYAPPARRMKKTPKKFLAPSDDWFYIFCVDLAWSPAFERKATKRLRQLKRESGDPTYEFEAIEYTRRYFPKDLAIGSRFFLGSFDHRGRQPADVYRECLVVDILDGKGIFYRYPAHYDTAYWEPFSALLRNGGYRLKNGRVIRRIDVDLANSILGDWGKLVEEDS